MSHSELTIRSVDPASSQDPSPDHIEIRFFGVLGVRLASRYRPLTIATAERAVAEDMLRFSGLREHQYGRAQCLALRSGDSVGLVACVRYRVWRHERSPEAGGEAGALRESVLLARG